MLATNFQQPVEVTQENSSNILNFDVFEVEVEFQALTGVQPRKSFEF
jgi:hypothetical protein